MTKLMIDSRGIKRRAKNLDYKIFPVNTEISVNLWSLFPGHRHGTRIKISGTDS